jgi:hypothetical protein
MNDKAPPIDAEVVTDHVARQAKPYVGMIQRPGFAFFTAGVLTGLILGGAAIYVIKKKL